MRRLKEVVVWLYIYFRSLDIPFAKLEPHLTDPATLSRSVNNDTYRRVRSMTSLVAEISFVLGGASGFSGLGNNRMSQRMTHCIRVNLDPSCLRDLDPDFIQCFLSQWGCWAELCWLSFYVGVVRVSSAPMFVDWRLPPCVFVFLNKVTKG